MTRSTILFAFLLAPGATLAHPGLQPAGLLDGLLHPLGGVDHLLAMVAVGLWAALAGGSARWAYPAAFLGGMLAGGALGLAGVAPPAVEPTVLASVIVLGALVALAARAPAALACAGLALFGLAHGAAHVSDFPGGAGAYVLGFLAGTGVLHGLGLGLGVWMQSMRAPVVARALGALTLLGGAAMSLG